MRFNPIVSMCSLVIILAFVLTCILATDGKKWENARGQGENGEHPGRASEKGELSGRAGAVSFCLLTRRKGGTLGGQGEEGEHPGRAGAGLHGNSLGSGLYLEYIISI